MIIIENESDDDDDMVQGIEHEGGRELLDKVEEQFG